MLTIRLSFRWGPALLLLTAALAALPAVGQQPEREFEIETTELGDGLALLIGKGGNILVSTGPDGAILIDDQFADMTEKIERAVEALGAGPVRFVINTHWHGDHVGGNENLARSGALIVAQRNVRKRMSSEQFMAAFDRSIPPSPQIALPVVTFAREVTLYRNGQEFHARHVANAHTDGDAIIHIRDVNVIHTGDAFFNGFYPFVDVDSGGSIRGMIAAADFVLSLCDDETRIIPGHGPLAKRADLIAYRDVLRHVMARVAALMQKGQGLEEIQAARPTSEFDEAWGGRMRPEDFVRVVVRSLEMERQAAH